ncbi:MAG: glycosyltransferase family A protein [Opitutaceae bacterium]|jgi:glycosyltransferase involved in cell wall biosynthesis
MTALVSILIPCRNAGPWLARTLESALAQTWPRTEIILVDDGSDDDSRAIAARFEARGVRIVAQGNRGASAARNTAIAGSRGDWLQFLDADDLLGPDKIARQMADALPGGEDHLFASDWSRFRDSPADADFAPQLLCADSAPVDWVVAKFENNAMMHPAAWLASRRLANKAGPWNETLSLDDDGEYFTRLVLASAGVRHCPGAVSYYRSRLPGSLSRGTSERAWASAFLSLELSADRLLSVEDSPRTRHACATAFQRFIYESYPRAADQRERAGARVAAFGGSEFRPEGGPKFQLARRLFGWRLARRLQLASDQINRLFR